MLWSEVLQLQCTASLQSPTSGPSFHVAVRPGQNCSIALMALLILKRILCSPQAARATSASAQGSVPQMPELRSCKVASVSCGAVVWRSFSESSGEHCPFWRSSLCFCWLFCCLNIPWATQWSNVFCMLAFALHSAHAGVKMRQVSVELPRSANARAVLFWQLSYAVPALQGAWLGLHSKSSIYKHTADVDWDVSV